MLRKIKFLFLIPLFFLASCFGGASDSGYVVPVYVGPGIGLGTIIAVVVSWSRNKSILWAIVHGLLGWFYIAYALLFPKR